jgi:DNA polymerase-4
VRLCPQLILIPPNFPLYKKESEAVREIFSRFTPRIQPLSLDEAYLDVTGAHDFGGSATLIAGEIRRLIEAERGLTASAGIAPNKFLAKIASDWNKPNGQFVIRPQDVEAFVEDLEIEKIHGVGKVTARKMHALGLRTCADIQRQPLAQLVAWFGSRGQELYNLSRGIDERPVQTNTKSKSVSVEETFNQDLTTFAECMARVPELYESFETRMRKFKGQAPIRGFVVKLRFHDFKITTHEKSSRAWPTPDDFVGLLERAWSRRSEPVRLIGIGVRLEGDEKERDPSQLSFELA